MDSTQAKLIAGKIFDMFCDDDEIQKAICNYGEWNSEKLYEVLDPRMKQIIINCLIDN